jgi:hypothetical protein
MTALRLCFNHLGVIGPYATYPAAKGRIAGFSAGATRETKEPSSALGR